MSRSYHLRETLRDFATYQRHGIKPKLMQAESVPQMTPQKKGDINATRQNELHRANVAAATIDEQRTEGHQIKHKTNFHE